MKTVVIILHYNNPDDTELCLRSLSKHSPHSPVVVVDNASIIGNIDVVCRKFDNVKALLHNTQNLGFGRGNNVGIKWVLENTDCKYLLILNNDTYVDDNVITLLEEYMDQNPQIDGCSPRIVFSHDPELLWYGGGEINWKKGGGRSWAIYKKFNGNTSPIEVTFIPACAMMLRRSIVIKIGGFDPRFFMYVEDIELCARILQNGGRFAYVPAAVVYHRAHGSVRIQTDSYIVPKSHANPKLVFFLENVICNSLLTLNTYAHGIDRLCGNAFLVAKWSRESIFYISKGRFDGIIAIVRGILAFWRIRKIPFVNELSDSSKR